jgi:hypothetical protein
VKLTALYAILLHGDGSVVGVLIERLKTMLKTKRKIGPARPIDSDIVRIIKFLLKYKNKDEVIEILNWVRQKRWDYLFEEEQKWFLENL